MSRRGAEMFLFTFVMDDNHKHPKDNKPDEIFIDENLFRRIGNNDMEALEELYHLTERTLYAYILSIVKNHDETLDLMQETYLKIISSAHLYKSMGKPLAWMFTIAKNLYLSKLRKDKRVINLETSEIEDSTKFSYISDNEDRIVLQTALNVLSEDERQIVILYAVSGLKHREIAESIGLKLSTTLSKYHRALKKIRAHLEGGVRHE